MEYIIGWVIKINWMAINNIVIVHAVLVLFTDCWLCVRLCGRFEKKIQIVFKASAKNNTSKLKKNLCYSIVSVLMIYYPE